MKQTISKHIPIVLCCDENYFSQALRVMHDVRSVLPEQKHNFHLFVKKDSISESKCKIALKVFNDSQSHLEIREVEEVEGGKVGEGAHLTVAAYFRMHIPEIMKEYDHVLYLDCDTCVRGNPYEIVSLCSPGAKIAAVKDRGGNFMIQDHAHIYLFDGREFDFREYLTSHLKLEKPENYFNSGVMLFNNRNISSQDMERLKEAVYIVTWLADQCALNNVFQNDVCLISDLYNYQLMVSGIEQHNSRKNEAVILHYVGGTKPWHAHDYWVAYGGESQHFYNQSMEAFKEFLKAKDPDFLQALNLE